MRDAGRRTVLLGGMAGLVTACQGGADGPRPVSGGPATPAAPAATPASTPAAAPASVARPGGVQVIYVWAWNCPVCPNFNTAQMEPYERSAEARRAPLRRVGVPRYSNIWTPGGYWPDDLEWVRQQGPNAVFGGARGGTPHTILVRGDTIVERRFGWSGWTNAVYPKLLEELARA